MDTYNKNFPDLPLRINMTPPLVNRQIIISFVSGDKLISDIKSINLLPTSRGFTVVSNDRFSTVVPPDWLTYRIIDKASESPKEVKNFRPEVFISLVVDFFSEEFKDNDNKKKPHERGKVFSSLVEYGKGQPEEYLDDLVLEAFEKHMTKELKVNVLNFCANVLKNLLQDDCHSEMTAVNMDINDHLQKISKILGIPFRNFPCDKR